MSQAVEVEPHAKIVKNVCYSIPEGSRSSSPGSDPLQTFSDGP